MDDENDLSEPKITSVDVEKIQRNINEIKLEEEMASTIKPITSEYGQGDEVVRVEASTTKYVEAYGRIKFTRKIVRGSRLHHSWNLLRSSYWTRKCKLQIAYSYYMDDTSPESQNTSENAPFTNKNSKTTIEEKRDIPELELQHKQPKIEEAINIDSSISDIENFDDYMEERNTFIKEFEEEIAQKNPSVHFPSLYYTGNKLTFVRKEDLVERLYHRNYKIYTIIYERLKTNQCTAHIATE